MGLIVKDVYACKLPVETKPPEGCYLGPDCSCGFSDGSTLSYQEWKGAITASNDRRESLYFIFVIIMVVVAVFAFKRLKRKLRAQQQI